MRRKAVREIIAERVRLVPPSGIRRFFDLIASMEGIISLGVGEPDFPTPWVIAEAGIRALEKGFTSYTSNYGLLELREEVARYLERRFGVAYDPRAEILITAGVSEGLDLALRALVDPGDEVLIPDPSYVAYVPCTIFAGGVPVRVPTFPEDEFKLKASEIERRISPRTKILILNYPHNPTGTTLSLEDLLPIAELVEREGLLVISDEIYEKLTYDAEHICFSSLPGMRERTVLLGGFSKSYAMTGWRIGYAAAPAEIIEAMMRIHQYTMLCAPTIAQKAAIAALREGEEEAARMKEEFDRRRKLLVSGLNEIGLDCFEPKGAFYAFPSIRRTPFTAMEFAERLLLEAKVVVVPGSAFGECGEGHVRVCYAASLAEIEEALERMYKFLRSI